MTTCWLYCFGCQFSHLHRWYGGKWVCANCGFTRKDHGESDDTAIDHDTDAALRWASAGAEASEPGALEQMAATGNNSDAEKTVLEEKG